VAISGGDDSEVVALDTVVMWIVVRSWIAHAHLVDIDVGSGDSRLVDACVQGPSHCRLADSAGTDDEESRKARDRSTPTEPLTDRIGGWSVRGASVMR